VKPKPDTVAMAPFGTTKPGEGSFVGATLGSQRNLFQTWIKNKIVGFTV